MTAGDDDLGAFRGELLGNREPETLSPAGDDGDLSFENLVHCPHLFPMAASGEISACQTVAEKSPVSNRRGSGTHTADDDIEESIGTEPPIGRRLHAPEETKQQQDVVGHKIAAHGARTPARVQ